MMVRNFAHDPNSRQNVKERLNLAQTGIEEVVQLPHFILDEKGDGLRAFALLEQVLSDIQGSEDRDGQRRLLRDFSVNRVDHFVDVRRDLPGKLFVFPPKRILRPEDLDKSEAKRS